MLRAHINQLATVSQDILQAANLELVYVHVVINRRIERHCIKSFIPQPLLLSSCC